MARWISLLALAGSTLGAALTWNDFISYDNEFVGPDFLLSRPWESDNTTLDAAQSVVAWADAVSQQGPWTVTSKTVTWAGEDKHEYLSWAPYWWPDCSKVGNTTALTQEQIWTECTYVDHDGQFVSDARSINDTGAYAAVCDAVFYTSIAWVITNETSYADKAIDYIRTWFIGNDTYMNPTLNFSQVVRGPPGNQQGSHYGILDMKTTAKILTGILLFRETKYTGWTQDDDDAMVTWALEFIHWLETHPFGKEEMTTPNNHGSFSFNTMVAFQILAKQEDEAKTYLNEYFNGIYQNQINSTGAEPFELERTRPYHYQTYGLSASIINIKLGAYLGLDFWNKTTKDGATVQDALNYAITMDPAKTNEVTSAPAAELYPNVAAVAAHYGDPDGKYAAYLAQHQPNYPQSPFFLWDQPLALPAGYKVSGSISTVSNTTSSGGSSKSSDGKGAAFSLLPPWLLLGCAILFAAPVLRVYL